MMGVFEDGKYECNSSAGWVSEDTFAILLQVTDTYFGALTVHISFKGDESSLLMKRSGQYIFEDVGGFMICKKN